MSAAVPPVSSANILAAHHGGPVDSGGDDGRGKTVEVKIECVRDVQRWLAAVNVASGNLEIGSVREAVAGWPRVAVLFLYALTSALLAASLPVLCWLLRFLCSAGCFDANVFRSGGMRMLHR